jgi:hypothetical protein
VWWFVLVAGCTAQSPADDGEDTDVEPLPSEVTLGTGEDAFVPVDDGDDITIVFGPQGGYHLTGSMRASGIVPGNPDSLADPHNPITAFRVWNEAGDPISGLQGAHEVLYQEGLEPTDTPGLFEMVGRRVFLDIASDDEIVGTTLTVEVEVHDTNDVVVTDSHTLHAVPHPFNP